GELGTRTPAPAHLTRFYLIVAAGGAGGSAATALLPPLLSTWVVEYPLSLMAVALGVFAVYASSYQQRESTMLPWWSRVLAVAVVPSIVGLGRFAVIEGREQQLEVVSASRNFFGWVRVREGEAPGGGRHRRLLHGNTIHGNQFLEPPRRYQPTTYYTEGSGVGRAVGWLHAMHDRPLRIGVVGLGAGTMAAHARTGDLVRIYEIDPQVVALSEGSDPVFTYVSESRGHIEIVPGDARVSLEREEPQGYDLLVLDAFSSDSVPAHLLTVEAFALYGRHLHDERSILAVHVSNRFLDLRGIVRTGGAAEGFSAVVVSHYPASDDEGAESTTWVLLARDPEVLAAFGDVTEGADEPWVRPWTDRWSNLFDVVADD